MPNLEEAERSVKSSYRETVRSLRATFKAVYASKPSLFVIIACALALSITQVVPVMHSTVPYSAVAALFFLLLGCVLYAKKGVIEATVTFSVGMFTAFTVPWTRPYFIVFITAILIFTLLIILLSSIKLAADVQSMMTMAANFYGSGDHESNLKQLQVVYAAGKPGETLSSLDRANAILFFAQRKVPADDMSSLFRTIFQISTVTQIDQTKVSTLLYKVYRAAEGPEEFDAYIALVEGYLLEGPASPEELVNSFIRTSFLLGTVFIDFQDYLTKLLLGIASGYEEERLYKFMAGEIG